MTFVCSKPFTNRGDRDRAPLSAKRPPTDDTLPSLNCRRDQVRREMSAAWGKPSPDMAALEALHYELQNLEFRIVTYERDNGLKSK